MQLCFDRGLRVIAITDHDSTEGLAEALSAAGELEGLTVVPGVELSADLPGTELHLLGYFVDYHDPSFQRTLREMRDGREQRGRRIVENLGGLGIDISWERVQELASGGAIGRPHIAQAMVEAGYVKYPKEAFDRYLGRNGPAYSERPRLSPPEAVEMLVLRGAAPVMAHPTYFSDIATDQDAARLRDTLFELKEVGLVGMEVYYGKYTPDEVRRLAEIAEETGLIPCGGSDYHAAGNPDEPEPGSAGPPMSSVDALRGGCREAKPRRLS